MREWRRLIGRGIVIGLCALACVVALSLHTVRASAANLSVTDCLDDGSAGSLRVVIGAAGSGDTIGFNQDCTAAGAITLGSTLTLTRNVTIDGVGHSVTVQAAATPNTATYRVFTITGGVVSISNLTIANGHTVGGLGQEGGGIQNNGALTMTNCILSGNRAFRPGGGIYNAPGGALTVTGSTLSGNFAVLGGGGIYNAGTLTVTNSTLSGNLSSSVGVPEGGGGIDNHGMVTVTSSTLSGNSAPVGGGIYNASGGALAVANSTLSSNSATGGPGQPDDGEGGGIDNFGTLTVTNSILTGNSASGIAGGIDNASSLDLTTGIATNSTLTVTGSTLSGNHAVLSGGAIFNTYASTVTVANSTLSGNSASGGGGGGIYNGAILSGGGASLAVTNSTIADNSATGGGGGGIYNSSGMMTLTDSTLARNSTSGFDGGGIYNYNGTVTVANSTLSGNSASDSGGGISNGIATISIYNHNGTVTLTNSTLSGNSAGVAGGGIGNFGMLTVTNSTLAGNSAANAGGIDVNSGTVNLTNSIVAGNTAPPSPDIGGPIAGNGHNLIGSTIGGSGFGASDLTNVSALLGPLASYGGPTQTLALLPGSPALGGGAAGTGIPTSDQRGIARTGHNDIGAFQSQGFNLTLVGGNNQSVPVTTAFSPLTVSVSAMQAGAPFNEPVDAGRVIFVGPGSGAGIQASPATAPISGGQASITPSANGVGGGPYAVTAVVTASGTPSVVFSLTNIAPTLTDITLTGPGGTPPATIKVGQTVQITATGTYSDGSTQNLTGQVQWSSGNPNVAPVDATGTVTGVRSGGPVTITATQGNMARQVTVTVVTPILTGVAPAPAPASRASGASTSGTAVPAPAPVPNGSPVSGGTAPIAAPPGR